MRSLIPSDVTFLLASFLSEKSEFEQFLLFAVENIRNIHLVENQLNIRQQERSQKYFDLSAFK